MHDFDAEDGTWLRPFVGNSLLGENLGWPLDLQAHWVFPNKKVVESWLKAIQSKVRHLFSTFLQAL